MVKVLDCGARGQGFDPRPRQKIFFFFFIWILRKLMSLRIIGLLVMALLFDAGL